MSKSKLFLCVALALTGALGTGVAQAGTGFGVFSTSTKHIRQLAAIGSFS
mgnify:CR=1 FL=1